MIDEPPAPPPAADASASELVIIETLPAPPRHACASYAVDPERPGAVICKAFSVIEAPDQADRVVIDLTQFVPAPPSDRCPDAAADPFNPEIVVCTASGPSPRLGPVMGPVDEGFASAIPRARIKLSDTASAEANLIKQGVGGIDADGAEVRLKIDF